VRLTLVRNATLLLELDGRRILVDPALDDVGARPPVEDTDNARRNPLVPLPMPAEDVVRNVDAVIVTHLHRDHLDEAGKRLLPRHLPVYCQPENDESLTELGLDARSVDEWIDWDGLEIVRIRGRHSLDQPLDEGLGPVSGFVVGGVYVVSDSVWCAEVEQAIELHGPAVAVVNAGAARFRGSAPISMTAEDVAEVAARVPTTVAVHLEAINHCPLTRADLRAALPQVLVPEDGETLEL
jgi:L-ascorbate metabolism protein UlaG (beta-lactamase superfamily)